MAHPPVSGTAPRRHVRRRMGRRARWLAAVLGAAVVAVGAWLGVRSAGGPLGLAMRALGPLVVTRRPAHGKGRPSAIVPYRPSDPVTILVMGTEVAPSYAAPQLTDSMMLVAYDPVHHAASAISVPRDLWVDVPGYGYQRINTAYENVGPAGAGLAVEKYFGVPVDYYAVVNYTSLVRLVDAVGGVTVNVPQRIYDPCYPNALENACTVLSIPAGIQHMDGTEALKFARERHAVPGEDLGRQADQMALLMALRSALLRPLNIFRLPAIVGALSGTVDTNLPLNELPGLARAVLHLPKAAIHTSVLSYSTGAIANWVTPGQADVLLPNVSVIHQETAALFSGVLRGLRGVTLQVEDGAAGNQPRATYFTGVLQAMGMATLPPQTASRMNYRHNHVYVNTAVAHTVPEVAPILGEMLGCMVQTQSIPGSSARVVVVLGAAFPNVQP